MMNAAVMADATSHVKDATCASSLDDDKDHASSCFTTTFVKKWSMEGMAIVETSPPTLMMVESGRVSGLWNLR
jgi:hypothetical protein